MNGLRTLLGALALSLLIYPPLPAHAQHDEPSDGSAWNVADPEFDGSAEDFEEDGPIVTDIDAVDRAHAAYLEDGDLQLVRPEQDVEAQPPKPPPGWVQGVARFIQALGPVFKVIFYLAVAAIVLGILYFLFGEAIRLRLGGKGKARERTEDDVLEDLRPDAAAARSLLEEADALAQQGRFAEAVHLLLFRSIEDIQVRVEGGVPTSLTAREIAGLGKLPERAKRGLRPIIQVVERSFFGGRAVDSDGWQQARRSYEDFAFGEGWA